MSDTTNTPVPAKYSIVGAGAIGGTLAVHLDAAGVPVQLIDADPAHVEAIRERGLVLITPDGATTARIPAYTLDDAPEQLTRVILATKAQATDSASAWIAGRLSDDGFVASLQNGLNEPTIAAHVGPERTVAAFVDLFADVMEPGVIKDGGHGAMSLGEYAGGTSARVQELADDLSHWGAPVVTDNVDGYLWAKLAFGAMLTATSLVDEDMSVVIDKHRPLMLELAREVSDVAEVAGIRLEGFDAYDPAAFARTAPAERTDEAFDYLVAWLATQSKTRSGIWRDIVVRKRPTEVPVHYAPIITRGEESGVPTPLLRALVDAIRLLETGQADMSEDLLVQLGTEAAK
jgi:2-dehydropantoate 2-reductase